MSANTDNAKSTTGPLPETRKEAAKGTQPRIFELLASPKTVNTFNLLAPKHLTGERLIRVMVQAVQRTPKLAECKASTLLGAMLSASALGLEPNTPLGHAYLIPFEKRKKVGNDWVTDYVDCQLIVGYKGLLDLARRSGNLVNIHADVVYAGDEFSFEYGSNMHLRHVPLGSRDAKVDKKWAYAFAKLSDGEAFEVLPYAEVLRIRDGSQGYASALSAKNRARGDAPKAWTEAPWVRYEHEMAAKTMIRRIAKFLPMSLNFQNAVAIDEASERGSINFDQMIELSADPQNFDPAAAITDTREDDPPMDGPAANQSQERERVEVRTDPEDRAAQQAKPVNQGQGAKQPEMALGEGQGKQGASLPPKAAKATSAPPPAAQQAQQRGPASLGDDDIM